MSNIYIASTCIIVLIIFNVIGGMIVKDITDTTITGETTINVNGSGLNQINEIQGNTLLGITKGILKVVLWNWDFNLWVNLMLTIIKVLLILSLGDMIWVG